MTLAQQVQITQLEIQILDTNNKNLLRVYRNMLLIITVIRKIDEVDIAKVICRFDEILGTPCVL